LSPHELTTNQKAAGSSPAERTTKYLQMHGFFFSNSPEDRPEPPI
jgi:hypothetical protein